MSTPVALNMPFLFLNAASVPDHDVRLSGPAPVAPTLPDFEDGDVDWDGPYGTPVELWNNVTHPTMTGVLYSPPNAGWYLNTEIPTGWYTVKKRIA